MAVSSDPEASYPPPPKDFSTAVPFAAEGDVDVYLAQRHCSPRFRLGCSGGDGIDTARHQQRSPRKTIPSWYVTSPEVSAAEDQSREVEGQTCPSNVTAKGPELISKGGLTTDEARRRLAKSGPNAMPDTSAHPIRMALDKFWAPVPWMLEAAIVVELALGKYVEAGIIALLLVFNAAL